MSNEEKKSTVSFKNGIHVHDGDKDVNVSFKHGVHVHSEDEDVDVSLNGIDIESGKNSVHLNKNEMRTFAKAEAKKHKGRIIISIALLVAAIAGYVLLGTYYGSHGWSYGWLLFLVVIIVDSVFNAIEKKKPSEFAYAVLATFIFLLLGFFRGCWHPAWIVFLTIPVYYTICDKIQKSNEE